MNQNRKLLFSVTRKDLNVTWFSNKKAGGQYLNKHPAGCRIVHRDSGAIATAQDTRSRTQNQKLALQRLIKHPRFRTWHAKACAKALTGTDVEEVVDKEMQPSNLKVEVKVNGVWKNENGPGRDVLAARHAHPLTGNDKQ